MQLIKIVLATVLFPVAHCRALLNAITLPIFILIVSWSLGLTFGSESRAIVILYYLAQFYGAAMLLTHCVLLITRNHTPPFLATQPIYLRCGLLLAGFTLLTHLLALLFLTLGVNLLNFNTPDAASQFDELTLVMARVLLFGTYFLIPHYIHSGQMAFSLVLRTYRRHLFSFIAIALLIELCRYLLGTVLIEAPSLAIALLLTVGSLLLRALEYLLFAFCYLGFFLEHESEASDNEHADQ